MLPYAEGASLLLMTSLLELLQPLRRILWLLCRLPQPLHRLDISYMVFFVLRVECYCICVGCYILYVTMREAILRDKNTLVQVEIVLNGSLMSVNKILCLRYRRNFMKTTR